MGIWLLTVLLIVFSLIACGGTVYAIEVFPGAGHVLMPAQTGCLGEAGSGSYIPEYLEILDGWLQHLSE